MKKKYHLFVLGAAVMLLTLTGCYGTSYEFDRMCDLVRDGSGIRYQPDISFGLGSVSLAMARGIVSLADDERDAKEILGCLSSVEVAVYKATGGSAKSNANYHEIISRMKSKGWDCIIKSRSTREMSLIFVNSNAGDRLTDIFIINTNSDEMAVVSAHGNLEKILSIAIRDKKIKMEMAENY